MANRQKMDEVESEQHGRCTESTNLACPNLEGHRVLQVNEAEERRERRDGHSL